MNRAKAYSYLGALLGTAAGFGVGYGAGLLGEVGGESAAGLTLLYGPLLIIAAILTKKLWSDNWFAAAIPFCIGFFICIPVAVLKGVEFISPYPLYRKFVGFTPIFPLVLAIPFAAFGTINGYHLGCLIGEKTDKLEQERKAYQQKLEAYMRKLRQWEAEGYKVEELKEKWGFK